MRPFTRVFLSDDLHPCCTDGTAPLMYVDKAVCTNPDGCGRGIEQGELVDYNWDTRVDAPSFVTDPPSDDVIRDPRRLEDLKTYVRNAAR